MIYTEFFELPSYDKGEILRYSGARKQDVSLDGIVDECIAECNGKLKGRVCYGEFPVRIKGNLIDLSFAEVESSALAKNLKGCESVVVFAATIGIEIDRIIQKYSRTDLSKAVFMQAIGAERIEALCDAFCNKLKSEKREKGLFLRPRFSAGYGDLSIELQRDIMRALDCGRKIGVTLNESLLMSPSKSVTAIVGISSTHCTSDFGCASCENKDCSFRKEKL